MRYASQIYIDNSAINPVVSLSKQKKSMYVIHIDLE